MLREFLPIDLCYIGGLVSIDWSELVDRGSLLPQLVLDEACGFVDCAAVICDSTSETCVKSLPFCLALG